MTFASLRPLLLFVDSYQHQLSNKRRVGPPSITNYYLVDAADNDKTRASKIRRTIERMSSTLLFSLTAIHGDKRTSFWMGGTGGNNGTRRVGDECNITDAIAS